jgi:UDP-perosamine 4-acetyltransferase
MEQNPDEKKNIIILGGGGHAKVVTGSALRHPGYNVSGFLDDNTQKEKLLDTPRLGNLLPPNQDLPPSLFAVGIGHVGQTKKRKEIIDAYEQAGHMMETVIAPSALVNQEVTLGKGVFVADGVIIQPGVTIGDYAIINTRSSIDHDCIIGKETHIAPGSVLSGNVTVGERVLIGTGAKVIQGMTIADDCIIGAGAVVVHNCEEQGGVYVGNPATLVKNKFNS